MNFIKPSIKFRDARQVIEREIAARKAKDFKIDNRRAQAWEKTKQKKIDKLVKSLAKTVGSELMAVIQITSNGNDEFRINASGFKEIRARKVWKERWKWSFWNGNEFVYYDLESAMDSARIDV